MRFKHAATLYAAALFAPSALLAAAPSVLAQPSTEQCRAQYAPRICERADLLSMSGRLNQQFERLLGSTSRNAHWQAKREEAEAELRETQDSDGAPISDMDYKARLRSWLATVDHALTQQQQPFHSPTAAQIHSAICQAQVPGSCRVHASGQLRPATAIDPSHDAPVTPDDQLIYYQLIEVRGTRGDVQYGVMFWCQTGETGKAPTKLLTYALDDASFLPPRITHNGLIWAPATQFGTGSGNADLVFTWDGDARAWRDLDIISWRAGLQAKLPKGFGVWKGVDYDFEGLAATSPLWRDADPNCCPSGGNALIDFEIQGRKLVLKQVRTMIFERERPRKN